MPEFAETLALIAFYTDQFTPFDNDGRYLLYSELRRDAVGEEPVYRSSPGALKASTLDGWFAQGRRPQSHNMDRLRHLLGQYFNAKSVPFNETWLDKKPDDLARELGIDTRDFRGALAASAETESITWVELPTVFDKGEASRVAQKYPGTYHLFRFHAMSNTLVREVLVIGDRFKDGIGRAKLISFRTMSDGFLYPSSHKFLLTFFPGCETLTVRRRQRSSTYFTGLRTRVSGSHNIPFAAKQLVIRVSDDCRLPQTEHEAQPLFELTGYMSPESDSYRAYAPWLACDPAGETVSVKGFGKNVLTIDSTIIWQAFERPAMSD